MRKIFIILFILLIPLSFLVFHDKGNAFLKPYFATYLESKLVADIEVDVRNLKIDWNHVEFEAELNEVIDIEVQGQLSLFKRTLDLNYRAKSNELKNKININGTLIGTFNNMNIEGDGDIVQSRVNYEFNLKDDLFKHIKIKINKADIASVLELTGQAAYATGKADINVDIENLEKKSINAKPQIVLYGILLNEKIFKQEFQIDVPSETILTAKLNAKFAAKAFHLSGIVESDFATLYLSKTYYNRKTQELSSDYKLLVPRLSKLLTNHKLRGKLQIVGAFKSKDSNVYLSGKCEDLGGRMVFDLKGNKLNAYLNGIDIEKLLLLFDEKPYATGKLMADIELSDVKKLKGVFNFKTKDAKSVDATLRKESNLNFGEDVYFSLDAKGDISQKEINMEAKFDSDIFAYSSSDINYDFSNKAINSTYLLHIPKLSKLNSLTGKTLNGELNIDGELNYRNEILMTGSSKSLGGNVDFRLKAEKLNAKIENISVEKLMNILDYPQVFKAKLVGKFNYDLVKGTGRFNSILNEAELLNTYLIQVIKDIRGVDLRDKRYGHTYFNATFRKNIVNINFKAQNKRVLLSIPSGQINKVSNNINAYYKVRVDNKRLEGKIKGDISDPKITLDSSKYMMSVMQDNMNPSSMSNSMMEGFFR